MRPSRKARRRRYSSAISRRRNDAARDAAAFECSWNFGNEPLGQGLFESAYQAILAHELTTKGLKVERERSVTFEYRGHVYPNLYRVDLFVEDCLIVEVKAVAAFAPIHDKQMLTYMRLMKCPLGFLFNFNELLMKNGIKRYRI